MLFPHPKRGWLVMVVGCSSCLIIPLGGYLNVVAQRHVDVYQFSVVWRFPIDFVLVFFPICVSILLFLVFLCAGHPKWRFCPQKKYLIFCGLLHEVTLRPCFFHLKTSNSIAPRFGHICANVLPGKDIRKSPCVTDSQRRCHALTCPDGLVDF